MFVALAGKMTDCNISVIIPAYNVAELIGRAITSVLSQEFPPQEILVIDDGSTDSTAEVVKNYPGVKYVYKPNGGAASARNIGIANAQGDWVAFLDADDEWLPNHLQAVTSIIQNNNLVWGCGGFKSENWHITANTIQYIDSRSEGVFQNYFQASSQAVTFSTIGMVIRRDVLLAAGMFDESMKTGEDLDLWYNIAHTHPAIGFAWPPTVIYHRRPGSLTDLATDTSKLYLALLNRHMAKSQLLGQDAVLRFNPKAHDLVRSILRQAARDGDSELARSLIRQHSDMIYGVHDRLLKTCIPIPLALQAYRWLVFLFCSSRATLGQLLGHSS
jgi:glycosyltransferase involved in cell wall biosynthesis